MKNSRKTRYYVATMKNSRKTRYYVATMNETYNFHLATRPFKTLDEALVEFNELTHPDFVVVQEVIKKTYTIFRGRRPVK